MNKVIHTNVVGWDRFSLESVTTKKFLFGTSTSFEVIENMHILFVSKDLDIARNYYNGVLNKARFEVARKKEEREALQRRLDEEAARSTVYVDNTPVNLNFRHDAYQPIMSGNSGDFGGGATSSWSDDSCSRSSSSYESSSSDSSSCSDSSSSSSSD